MASKQAFGNEISVDEQALEHERAVERDDRGFEVVEETLDLRATVQQEKQAKVNSNHPDGIVQDFSHLTLAQEERICAREAELEQISAQAELGTQDGRAERTREVVTEQVRLPPVQIRRGHFCDSARRAERVASNAVEFGPLGTS
jgi:hypothetical protein